VANAKHPTGIRSGKMPEIGEVKKAHEIGYKCPRIKYIWQACSDCGKQRWVRIVKNKPVSLICNACSAKKTGAMFNGSKSGKWKGGRRRTTEGYIEIRIYPESFFYSMSQRHGYAILEHRLIMAQHLGRCLQRWEIVHHKNGVKDDNRLENLELDIQGSHVISHHKGYSDGFAKGYLDGQGKIIKELQNRVTLLEAELELVKNNEPFMTTRTR